MGTRRKTVRELRQRAEAALQTASSERAEALLEQLLSRAEGGSEAALFAHRHLAEIRLESNPWHAALHLRQVLQRETNDDVLHALMGLCQALLGNFRVAVRAYRQALSIAPHTPWYHHNLGHLIDVALDEPARAEPHLRRAHEMEPDHDEILGSLAHCLARLGRPEEALAFAKRAEEEAPNNPDHEQLTQWIEAGAPGERGPVSKIPCAPAPQPPDEVVQLLQRKMREGDFSTDEINLAKLLWADVQDRCRPRVVKPAVHAAALEYAIAFIQRRPGFTQASVARRYGIASTSLSSRYGQMRDALALCPGDPRYAVDL